MKKSTGDFSIG